MFSWRNKKNISTFWLKKCLIQSYVGFRIQMIASFTLEHLRGILSIFQTFYLFLNFILALCSMIFIKSHIHLWLRKVLSMLAYEKRDLMVFRFVVLQMHMCRHLFGLQTCVYISRHTIVAGYYGFALDVRVSVCLSVRPTVRPSLSHMSIHPSICFSFPDDNLSKHQWIFTKLGVCIDIMEICFGIANGQILSNFYGVICLWHDNSGVLRGLYYMSANNKLSGQIEVMSRLPWAFAGRLCDKYPFLMCWLNWTLPMGRLIWAYRCPEDFFLEVNIINL